MSNIKPPMYNLRVYCESVWKPYNRQVKSKGLSMNKEYFHVFQPRHGKQVFKQYCTNCDKSYKIKILSASAFKERILLRILAYFILYLLLHGMVTWLMLLIGSIIILDFLNVLFTGFALANKKHYTKIVQKYDPSEYQEYLQPTKPRFY